MTARSVLPTSQLHAGFLGDKRVAAVTVLLKTACNFTYTTSHQHLLILLASYRAAAEDSYIVHCRHKRGTVLSNQQNDSVLVARLVKKRKVVKKTHKLNHFLLHYLKL